MANTANNIKNSWSIKDFLKEFKKNRMQVGQCHNQTTGEPFNTLVLSDKNAPNPRDTYAFVSFSKKIMSETDGKGLTPQEIVQDKDNLQIVLCENSRGEDMYALCHKGDSSWQDVDLDLL